MHVAVKISTGFNDNSRLGSPISIDGHGRWTDKVFIECFSAIAEIRMRIASRFIWSHPICRRVFRGVSLAVFDGDHSASPIQHDLARLA
jgi:hypothetical protein